MFERTDRQLPLPVPSFVRFYAPLLALLAMTGPLSATDRQEQAEKGRVTYASQCAECHHMTLKGSGHGPELAGPNMK